MLGLWLHGGIANAKLVSRGGRNLGNDSSIRAELRRGLPYREALTSARMVRLSSRSRERWSGGQKHTQRPAEINRKSNLAGVQKGQHLPHFVAKMQAHCLLHRSLGNT